MTSPDLSAPTQVMERGDGPVPPTRSAERGLVASSIASVREVVASRELIRNLAVRELKTRYKRSALGFFWTLLNPIGLMAVFTLVFGTAFRNTNIHHFPLFFLVGYLPWLFFQTAAMMSTGVIVANGSLITKVYFPRGVLPVSVVASQFVHFCAAMSFLLIGLFAFGFNFLPLLPLLVIAVVLLAIFATGVSLILAALNTVLRDIAELSSLFFMLWFYVSPIIYTEALLPENYRWVLRINPMTYFIRLFRGALYDLTWPPLYNIAIATVLAFGSVVVGIAVFVRLSDRFAKEI